MPRNKMTDSGNINVEVNEFYSLLSINKHVGPSSFEHAIRKTGFGKFNVMLMVFTVCGIFSPMFETTTMSYIFGSAQCDLNLSLQDKGYLNSMVFAGMISSSFIWGFLLDTFGRRKLMVYGYFLDATLVFISSLSQSFTMLAVCKFLGGLIINGPFSAMIAYLSEFHSSKYRSRIQLVNGSLTSLAQIVLPVLAWCILPLSIDITLFNNVKLRSWNIFIMVCGLCPLISGVIFFFLPESPKFLMTRGENEKAMEVLQKVYSWNTGNPPESYPVMELIQEVSDDDDEEVTDQKKFNTVNKGVQKLTPLFKSPYITKFILLTIIAILIFSSLNILRLWTPQLFQAMEDYKAINNGSTADLCTMLDVIKPKSTNGTCVPQNVGEARVYINSISVSTLSISCYAIAGSLITKLGKKKMLIILASTASIACFSLTFTQGAILTTLLIAIFISCGNIGANIVLSVVVDVFPTTLRAFAISLVMAIGRVGISSGNMIFPVLLQAGCNPPFFVVGGAMAAGGIMCLLLPNTENKPLQ